MQNPIDFRGNHGKNINLENAGKIGNNLPYGLNLNSSVFFQF
jgi:hypothetical protein